MGMTAIDVLRRASQRIRYNGWRKGPRLPKEFTGWSLHEALIAKNSAPAAVEAAIAAVTTEILFTTGWGHGGDNLLDVFNDDPKTEAKDVAKVLQNAIKSLQGAEAA